MTRLIDADELLKHIPTEEMCSRFAVVNALTVDAVEVVRCKDCKYSDTFSEMTEEPHSQLKCLGIRYGGVEPMWFCEHGERREE